MAAKKQLINLSEQQKSWIMSVVSHSMDSGQSTNQTEIIRALVDQAMVQDPETFVGHLAKMRVKSRLDDIARREKALQEEKEKLTAELQTTGGHLVER
jgi:hypothetical protein